MSLPLARQRDARIAGIRSEATLEAVHRRRSHLFLVMVIVLLALCVATAIAPMGDGRGPLDPAILRVGMILLSATFVIYAVEKERALRRLEATLVEDQRQLAVLVRETDQLHRLINAGQALTATLELERVVDLALAAAMRTFEAPGGAVFLDRGDLVLQAAHGQRQSQELLTRQAREVATRHAPSLLPGRRPEDPVGMAAPLVHDGTLVGVLVLDGDATTDFGEGDLDTLETFARHAAAAIANARLYRAEKVANDQFAGLRDVQHEFRWLSTAG